MLAATVLPAGGRGLLAPGARGATCSRSASSPSSALLADCHRRERLHGAAEDGGRARALGGALRLGAHLRPRSSQGGLQLLYGQSAAVSAVVHVDARGEPRAARPSSRRRARASTRASSRAAVTAAHAGRVGADRCVGPQGAGGPRRGVYAHAPSGQPAVAVAVKLADGERRALRARGGRRSPSWRRCSRGARRAGPERIDLVDSRAAQSSPAPRPRCALRPLDPELSEPWRPPRPALGSFRVAGPPRWVSHGPGGRRASGFEVRRARGRGQRPGRACDLRHTVLASIVAALSPCCSVLGALFTRRLNRRLGRGGGAAPRPLAAESCRSACRCEGQDELTRAGPDLQPHGRGARGARRRGCCAGTTTCKAPRGRGHARSSGGPGPAARGAEAGGGGAAGRGRGA